jgi:8-hydroxy-5-deazaflavin:NADPH oxidoreductase
LKVLFILPPFSALVFSANCIPHQRNSQKETQMNIAILGTGVVGQTLAAALAAKGHNVTIGTRDIAATKARREPNAYGMPGFGVWHEANANVKLAQFADAAANAELVINATNGVGALEALKLARAESLGNKILVDVANDLDGSQGMPPRLSVTDAPGHGLGERIQAAYPNLRVVKTLNTLNAMVMLAPQSLPGDTSLFMCGNDAQAKQTVRALLESFGWKDVIDLGDIATARATEMLLPVWIRLWGALGNPNFNFKIVR